MSIMSILNKYAPELSLYFGRCRIILSCWVIPLRRLAVQTFTPNDGASARAFALLIIAVLTFAVRGSDGDEGSRAALAGGAAIILTLILNLISLRFAVTENMVISAYASTIIVMFLYIFSRLVYFFYDPTVLTNDPSLVHQVLSCAVTAGLAAFALLLLKSKLWDKRQIGCDGILHAAILSGGSTIILLIIAFMNSRSFELFGKLMKWLSKLNAS
jgi:hypothetical protein